MTEDQRMTVWIVTLNSHIKGVCSTAEKAHALLYAVKAGMKPNRTGEWRGEGLSWCAENVTSLCAQPWTVDEHYFEEPLL